MADSLSTAESDKQLNKNIVTAIYALQAISFFLGITYLVAVIIIYIKKSDYTGTWLESHFRWQLRTFWFSVLWGVIGFATFVYVIGYFILIANAIWVIYRIIKGWLKLNDNKEMYV